MLSGLFYFLPIGAVYRLIIFSGLIFAVYPNDLFIEKLHNFGNREIKTVFR